MWPIPMSFVKSAVLSDSLSLTHSLSPFLLCHICIPFSQMHSHTTQVAKIVYNVQPTIYGDVSISSIPIMFCVPPALDCLLPSWHVTDTSSTGFRGDHRGQAHQHCLLQRKAQFPHGPDLLRVGSRTAASPLHQVSGTRGVLTVAT